MNFITKKKIKELIENFYLDIDSVEVMKEFISYIPVHDTDTYILTNHEYLLGEHIFVPVRYGKTTVPTYVRELERNFDAEFTIPRTIYRCTNCGTYAVDSYNCITSVLPAHHIVKKQSVKQFRNSLHKFVSKLYCGRVIKHNPTKALEMINWNIQNLFYSRDKAYAKAYQFYNENQIIFLDNERKKIRHIPFTLKENFDETTPYIIKQAGVPVRVTLVCSSYMAARMMYFMHPTYNSHKVFAGQNNRRKHKYKNSFVKDKL